MGVMSTGLGHGIITNMGARCIDLGHNVISDKGTMFTGLRQL